MMDKKGLKIVGSCVLSTALVALIFLVVLRFTQPDCELIAIDPAHLRLTALNEWSKEKPFRSHDKSMLLKLAAYLEFSGDKHLSESTTSKPSFTSSPSAYHNWSNQTANQSSTLAGSSPFSNNLAQSQQQNNRAPQASQPLTGFSSQQLANSSLQTTVGNLTNKRYLPLELDDIEMKKLDENRYRYTLEMNCAVIYVVFVRRPDRVYVQSIQLERLRPEGHRGKTSCEVQLPAQGAFSVEVHEGLARYYCDQPLHFGCYYRQAGAQVHLAELHIHSIEFETGSNATKPNHKSREFRATRSECSPMF